MAVHTIVYQVDILNGWSLFYTHCLQFKTHRSPTHDTAYTQQLTPPVYSVK